MTFLDVTTYIMYSLPIVIGLSLTCGLLSAIFVGIYCEAAGVHLGFGDKDMQKREETQNRAFGYVYKHATKALLVIVLCGLIPTHSRIFAVKIAALKSEAMTRENIVNGVEHFKAVLKKLECKYLGCKDE